MTKRRLITDFVDAAVWDAVKREYFTGIELPLDSTEKYLQLLANFKANPNTAVTDNGDGSYTIAFVGAN